MAAKRKPKTRHGATQPEDERAAKAVLLRLRPDVIALLDEIRGTMQRSAYVTSLIRRSEADRAGLDRGADSPRE